MLKAHGITCIFKKTKEKDVNESVFALKKPFFYVQFSKKMKNERK